MKVTIWLEQAKVQGEEATEGAPEVFFTQLPMRDYAGRGVAVQSLAEQVLNLYES